MQKLSTTTKEAYETLEFLGDSIVGSIVSSYIFERFFILFIIKMKEFLLN